MLKITINNRGAWGCCDGDPITSGSVGYPVQFVFSPEWDGLTKIAVFIGSGVTFEMPLINTNETVIPSEVLADAGGQLLVGVYGANAGSGVVMPTVLVKISQINAGAVPPIVSPAVPTPSWAVQVQDAAENTLARANEAISHYPQIINDYWYVWDVERGEYVNTGVKATGEGGGGGGGGGGGTPDYTDLSNKPSIGGVTLEGNKTVAQLGLVAAQQGAGLIPDADLQQISDNADAITALQGDVQQQGTDLGALQNEVDAIEEKIPNQASAQNQLADKAFVNSSINSSAAFFRGSFPTKAALQAVSWQTSNPAVANYVTNNDYAVVLDDESQNDECWRYVYVSGTGWQAQYRINETPLTAAQLAALNSGATAQNIAAIAGKAEATSVAAQAVVGSGGVISFKNAGGTELFTVTLPIYGGGVT